MTPSQLLVSVRSQIDESEASFYSDEELYRYMSDGENEFSQKVPCTEATTTDVSVASQREYDRPTDALEILRITWDSVKLKKISLNDIDIAEGTSYGGASTSTGNVVYYYDFAKKIGLSPIPTEAKTIAYYYIKKPTELSSSSTEFTIPEQYSSAIADYMLFRMYMKDQMPNEANNHFSLWTQSVEKALLQWNERKQSDNYKCVIDEDEYPFSDLGII